jgi:hypothetical protein
MNASAPPGPLLLSHLQRAADLHSAAAAAGLQVDTWTAVEAALRDVIGPLGVAALLARSLKLAARQHPCLLPACAAPSAAPDLAALHGALTEQTLSDALAAGQALVRAYEDLLSSLIGPALAERLLRPVWRTTPEDPRIEDGLPEPAGLLGGQPPQMHQE